MNRLQKIHQLEAELGSLKSELMKGVELPEIKCIRCECVITSMEDQIKFDNHQSLQKLWWNGGTVSLCSPGYGSRFDLSTFFLPICDNCIEEQLENNILIDLKEYQTKIREQFEKDV